MGFQNECCKNGLSSSSKREQNVFENLCPHALLWGVTLVQMQGLRDGRRDTPLPGPLFLRWSSLTGSREFYRAGGGPWMGNT